jgi:hypothetical protein
MKKRANSSGKLSLNTETVRRLASEQLENAAGGVSRAPGCNTSPLSLCECPTKRICTFSHLGC